MPASDELPVNSQFQWIALHRKRFSIWTMRLSLQILWLTYRFAIEGNYWSMLEGRDDLLPDHTLYNVFCTCQQVLSIIKKKNHQTNQCSYTQCSFLASPEINESRDLVNWGKRQPGTLQDTSSFMLAWVRASLAFCTYIFI